MNQPPLSPHSEPDETPERDRHEPPQAPPSATTEEERDTAGTQPATEPERAAHAPEWESLETAAARMRGEERTEEETRAREPGASPPRFPATPPPMPTFGAPQSPPRMAPPPPRPPEQGSYTPPPQRPPEQGAYAPPTAPPVQEPPPYPPRAPMPQPAPPGSVAEPPRPYEGGRYVPPPPMPASGPATTAREWTTSTAVPAVQAPAAPVMRNNPANTFLLGAIALLLLVLAVFQGINTFYPKAVKPSGVQQVQVQPRTLKPETVSEVKDTTDKAQQALNQFNQQAQQAYANASNDQQRSAILLQLSIFLQQIIAQQNNDLLLIYQDLYGPSGKPSP